MTYARARLWLGITGVGTWTVLASLVLATGLASTLFPTPTDLPGEIARLFAVWVVLSLIALPFDIVGGQVLPRRFDRPVLPPARWFARWFRGAVVQIVLWTVVSGSIVFLGRAGGQFAALAGVAGWIAAAIALQGGIARLVGAQRLQESVLAEETELLARAEIPRSMPTPTCLLYTSPSPRD